MILHVLRSMLLPRHLHRLNKLLLNVRLMSSVPNSSSSSRRRSVPDGVWPTMITPFLNDASKSVDWNALDLLTNWYIKSGCSGIFSVCLSSEMFQLSNEERLAIAQRVARTAAGRVPVVAGATFEGGLEQQAELMKEMGKHVDAVVIITNQICSMDESDSVWLANVKKLMQMTGDLPLGLYETPVPQVRSLTPEMLAWCANSGRFLFHKDTSLQTDTMLKKLVAVQALPDNPMKFFTAKLQFLKTCLDHGGNGFSGVTANFFPWLIVWMCNNVHAPEERSKVQQFLSVSDRVIAHKYPTSSKHYLATHCHAPIHPVSRCHDVTINDQDALALHGMHQMMTDLCQEMSISPVDL